MLSTLPPHNVPLYGMPELNPAAKPRTLALTVMLQPPNRIAKEAYNNVSKILRMYPNVSYKGMLAEDSNLMLAQTKMDENFHHYTAESAFYKTATDDEAANRKAVVSNHLDNPEFILSRINDKEAEAKITDTNSIAKPVMVDTGHGVFNYSPSEPDQVNIVKRSNQSFANRRDRFFIPPAPGAEAGDTRNELDALIAKAKSREHLTTVRGSKNNGR